MTTLDEQLESAREEFQTTQKRHELQMLEYANRTSRAVTMEANGGEWGTIVDRNEFLRDTPGWYFGAQHKMSLPHNRKDGNFYPFFRTEQDLQRIRGESQFVSYYHPVATGLLDDLANYTISTGYDYSFAHKPTSVIDDAVLFACQDVVDEFRERIDMEFPDASYERDIFKKTRESGEAFIWIRDAGDGFSELELAEPEWVTEPRNVSAIQDHIGMHDKVDWKYGIATTPNRPTHRHGYFVMWNGDPGSWKVHKPEEMLHLKLHTPRCVKRGLPDFYGVTDLLEMQLKLLKSTARGATIQAAIAMIREHQQGMQRSNIEALIDGNKHGTYNAPQLPGGSGTRQRRIKEYPEGTVLDVSGSKYIAGPLGQPHGPSYVEIGQAVVRIIGARWSMPEHMISNAISGGGGARAAIVEMGTPFARATIKRQSLYKKYFAAIMWKVIERAVFYGRIPSTLEEIKQNLDLRVEPPEATQRNEAEQHLVMAGRQQAGIISKAHWSKKIGVDRAEQKEQIDSEVQDDAMMQQAIADPLGVNAPNETLNKQAQGKQGQGDVGRQQMQGAGADAVPQDRTQGKVNAVQSMKQKLAAGRAGKDVAGFGGS